MMLFVYGTLKRGGSNVVLIRDQRFLGEVVTVPAYRMYDLGLYPGLIRDDAGGVSVNGELWEVSACAIAELDDFEMSAGEFERQRIELIHVEGPVEAYFYTGSVPAGARSSDRWPPS